MRNNNRNNGQSDLDDMNSSQYDVLLEKCKLYLKLAEGLKYFQNGKH